MPHRTPHFLRSLAAPLARNGRLRRVLLGFVVLALVSVVSRPAHAAVPMCSSDGRSVIAPPIILPWRELKLEAGAPCQQPENPLLRSMPDQQRQAPSSPPAPAPLRAMPVRTSELPRPASMRLCVDASPAPVSLHLVDSIYRPPRG
jgi:hypothetical protein